MHDVLQGVAQYKLKLFLYLKEKHVRTEELHIRIQSFDNGFMQICEGSNDLGLTAL